MGEFSPRNLSQSDMVLCNALFIVYEIMKV